MTPEGLCTKCSATQYCAEHDPGASGVSTPPASEPEVDLLPMDDGPGRLAVAHIRQVLGPASARVLARRLLPQTGEPLQRPTGLQRFMERVYPDAMVAEGEFESWEAFSRACLSRWIQQNQYWKERAALAPSQPIKNEETIP